MFCKPTGERCQGVSAGSNPEPERGQPAPPGGILQRLHQAQEVHRVGVQHHRHELRAAHRRLRFRCSTATGAGLTLGQCSVLRVSRKNIFNIYLKQTQLELLMLISSSYKAVPITASPTSLWIRGLVTTTNYDLMAEKEPASESVTATSWRHALPSL